MPKLKWAMSKVKKSDPYQVSYITSLRGSLKRCSGLDLVPANFDNDQAAIAIFHAPWPLLSHNDEKNPRFVYANCMGMRVFGLAPERLRQHHSTETALPDDRPEREQLLARVREYGFVDDYSGVRVSAQGAKFAIRQAVVWNVINARGHYLGQAAMFKHWHYLP